MQKFSIESSGRADLYGDDDDGHLYLVKDVDEALAAKDRDLADANHALLLASNSADALRRVAEQRQREIERLRRAVEWCLLHGASRDEEGVFCVAAAVVGIKDPALKVPAEFADIIKPTTGASNG